MNKQQRKQLSEWIEQINDIASAIREMSEEEQEKIDNMPDNLQGSDRYQEMEEAQYNLEQLADDLENATYNADSDFGL